MARTPSLAAFRALACAAQALRSWARAAAAQMSWSDAAQRSLRAIRRTQNDNQRSQSLGQRGVWLRRSDAPVRRLAPITGANAILPCSMASSNRATRPSAIIGRGMSRTLSTSREPSSGKTLSTPTSNRMNMNTKTNTSISTPERRFSLQIGEIVLNFGGNLRVITGELWDDSRMSPSWHCKMK